MRFHTDDAEVLGQRQHHPVAKMLVQRNEGSFVPHGTFKNQRVVGAGLADF